MNTSSRRASHPRTAAALASVTISRTRGRRVPIFRSRRDPPPTENTTLITALLHLELASCVLLVTW
jgi:hypothetical protein